MKTRSFTLRTRAEALGDRRVRFVASTADLDSYNSVVHPGGCRLDRFRAAGSLPLLWNHDRDNPASVLGKVVEVEVRADAVVCVGEFRQSPQADEVLGMVRDGTIRGCSIGFCDEVTQSDERGVVHVMEWTLAELSVCPVGANPRALAVRSFTLTSRVAAHTSFIKRAAAPNPTVSRSHMDPKMILEKLGLAEGAKPEEIASALIRYLAGSDSDADKQSVVMGLLSMLAPAPSASSASDGGKEAALEAMTDEVRKLQARVAELEGAKADAEKKAEPTPEERAAKAIERGQWPIGQRSVLVEQFKSNKTPYLFPEKTFSGRSVAYTAGGNPRQPTVEKPAGDSAVKGLFAEVENRIANATGVK